jgi:hypothetical protein
VIENKMKHMSAPGLEINRHAPLSEADKAFIKAGGSVSFRRTATGVVKTRIPKREPSELDLRFEHQKHLRTFAELRNQERKRS